MTYENNPDNQGWKVLNVGGGKKNAPLPPQYKGWQHIHLDIDPMTDPDIICDARELVNLHVNQYDAVYCSHNLEHYYLHDVHKVLQGINHVLKPNGFAHIRVPDIDALMKVVVEKEMDIEDVLYLSGMGPITIRDVIYGYGVEIERSGKDFYAHKTGFTPRSLRKILINNGFPRVFIGTQNIEVIGLAFKDKPTDYILRLFGVSAT